MYDPRDDMELTDYITARLMVLDPGLAYCTPASTDGEALWIMDAGQKVPMGMDCHEAEAAGLDMVWVDFQIIPGELYDGSDGFNIGWDAFTPGGKVLGQSMPYNYTPRVWTTDKEELWCRARSTIDALFDYVQAKAWRRE